MNAITKKIRIRRNEMERNEKVNEDECNEMRTMMRLSGLLVMRVEYCEVARAASECREADRAAKAAQRQQSLRLNRRAAAIHAMAAIGASIALLSAALLCHDEQ